MEPKYILSLPRWDLQACLMQESRQRNGIERGPLWTCRVHRRHLHKGYPIVLPYPGQYSAVYPIPITLLSCFWCWFLELCIWTNAYFAKAQMVHSCVEFRYISHLFTLYISFHCRWEERQLNHKRGISKYKFSSNLKCDFIFKFCHRHSTSRILLPALKSVKIMQIFGYRLNYC